VRADRQSDRLLARCRKALAEHRRRARADGVTLPYGLAELLRLARGTVQCYLCRLPVALDFQIDHRTPTARGGKHSPDNLGVAHRECNSAKGLLTSEEYLQLLGLLKTFHPTAAADVLRRLRAGGRLYRGAR
jgi:5-methylcytosine-specific restriction endonuclease McrA